MAAGNQRGGDWELREWGTGRLFRLATAGEREEAREAARWDGGCGILAVPIDGRLRMCLVVKRRKWQRVGKRSA